MFLLSLNYQKMRGRLLKIGCLVGLVGMIVVLLTTSVVAKESVFEVTRLVINIPSFTLSVVQGDTVVKKYPVAVGKPSAPTPVGEFRVISKVVNPTWYPPDGSRPVPPGPANPLGRRWLGFSPSGYGVHGNNNENSIGKAVSLGCVRMHNSDVEELFGRISLGTELRITYETVDVEMDPTTGQTHLVFYPDVYYRGKLTVEAVEEKLKAFALPISFNKGRIEAAIRSSGSVPSYVCLGMKVHMNGSEVIIDTEIVNGETLVAARPILQSFGLPVIWDPEKQAVVSGTAVLPAHVRSGQSFVHLSDLERQLGIKSHWHELEQLIEFFVWKVIVEQTELAGGAWIDDKGIWLAIGRIAHALELPVVMIPERAVVIDGQGKEWLGRVCGEDIYVSAEMLTEILPIKVIILEDQKRIEIMRRS